MNRIIYFLITFIVWLLLTWSLDSQNVVAGLAVSVAVTLLIGHVFFPKSEQILNLRRVLWFLYFIPVFFIHMVRANIDVAYRVLHLNVPIRPGIIKVKTTLKSDIGLTFLANAITLTPGTLTIDIIDGNIYIHWINVKSDDPAEQREMVVRRFESILAKVFE